MINKTDLEMLKSRMEAVSGFDRILASKKAEYEKDIAVTKGMKAKVLEEISDLKLVIGEAAIEDYKVSGNKKQPGGVKVQDKKWKTVDYDSTRALEFAKEKDMFLLLDKKAFETAAPSLNLDFVTIESGTNPAITFPKEIKLED